jgi:hypothetical protein
MAMPKKRQIGTFVVWLGIIIFSALGIAVVTTDKLLLEDEAWLLE